MKVAAIGFALVFAATANAQTGAWGQCGGNNFSGSTACVSGYVCKFVNDSIHKKTNIIQPPFAHSDYSQCVPGEAPQTTTTARPPVTDSSVCSATVTVTVPGQTVTSTVPGPVVTVTVGSGITSTRTITTTTVTPTGNYTAVVDGVAKRISVGPGGQTVTLAQGVANTDHKVEFYRDNESSEGVSTFLGVVAGTLKAAPALPARRIELVGDSISAGYGNLGLENHAAGGSCTYSPATSSWYATYGAIAGRALNAQVTTIARSGWGISRGYGGSADAKLPTIYPTYLGSGAANWNYKPSVDALVINLGTNDWSVGDPGTTYETLYVSFLRTIRSGYPNAYIFLTIGSLLDPVKLAEAKTRLANVIKQSGETRIATFDYGTQDVTITGCDYHPSEAEHKRMAAILQQKLSATLGW
ncbi:hypothetical protein HK097_003841 [Rhizophlyctis rosea]|uniref:CBM1 domain-containing protein n=1 Tax=Rhizophlyctis rosea TaxID=64517 RepID=A0AAD5X6P3_9FUNG|nr:hypothetical protein HK097_003841 [Rhizophlyctis rosea]